MIMDMWKEHASGPLHLLHVGFGAGGLLVPQIMAHFTSNKLPKSRDNPAVDHCLSRDNLTNQVNRTTVLANQTAASIASNATTSNSLQYGYLMISGLLVVVSVIWFVFGFIERKRTAQKSCLISSTLKESLNLNSCVPGRPACAFFLYTLIFIWSFVSIASDLVLAKYLYSYARAVLCWPKSEAVNLLTAYWLSFTIGRFIGFISANFVHMKYIILVEGIGSAIVAIVLFIFSSNRYVLWVCVCAWGLLIGPCYPSGLAWINRYMIVTTTGVTVIEIFNGMSNILFLFIIGYFIKYEGIQVITTFVLALGVLIGTMSIVMKSAACQLGDRFKKEAE